MSFPVDRVQIWDEIKEDDWDKPESHEAKEKELPITIARREGNFEVVVEYCVPNAIAVRKACEEYRSISEFQKFKKDSAKLRLLEIVRFLREKFEESRKNSLDSPEHWGHRMCALVLYCKLVWAAEWIDFVLEGNEMVRAMIPDLPLEPPSKPVAAVPSTKDAGIFDIGAGNGVLS
ncbi:MAG: hypothetical protein ACYTEQ_12305 [Planctomycetota bacterium]|jgi:hypothetical protein